MAQPGNSNDHIVIPVAEEQLDVQRRVSPTATVRVQTHTQTHEQVIDLPLASETVEVERVQVNRTVDAPEQVRQEGDVLIIPVMEEVLVVQKKLVVREEIRLTTRRTEHHDPQRVALRREQAEVQRIPAQINKNSK